MHLHGLLVTSRRKQKRCELGFTLPFPAKLLIPLQEKNWQLFWIYDEVAQPAHVAAYEFAISCLRIYDIIITTLWNDYAKECANHKQYRIGSQLPLSLHQFPFVAFVLSESLEMRHWLMTVVHQQKLPSHKYSKYNPPQSYNPTNVKIPLSAYSYTTSFNSSMFSHVNTVTDLDLKLINWLWFDLLYEQTMRGQIKASTNTTQFSDNNTFRLHTCRIFYHYKIYNVLCTSMLFPSI